MESFYDFSTVINSGGFKKKKKCTRFSLHPLVSYPPIRQNAVTIMATATVQGRWAFREYYH